MAISSTIDLSKLPPPEIIRQVDAEQIWREVKGHLVEAIPHLERVLSAEGQLVTMLGQAFADREAMLRSQFNDLARGNMLALASGSDLEHLAAFYDVTRLVVQAADNSANPPIPLIMETDAALRARTQLAMDGFSTAGPRAAYRFHARSADGRVKDVGVTNPAPGRVLVTVLSTLGDGAPTADLIEKVAQAVNDENVRPLCSSVTVAGPTIQTYSVVANLTLYDGPDEAVVLAASREQLAQKITDLHAIGHDVTRSALTAALYQPGVQKVDLLQPAADIVANKTSAAYCSSEPAITVVGRDV